MEQLSFFNYKVAFSGGLGHTLPDISRLPVIVYGLFLDRSESTNNLFHTK